MARAMLEFLCSQVCSLSMRRRRDASSVQEHLRRCDKKMDKQNIVVTYNVSPEDKALFLEVLGSFATLTYLNEISPAQRTQSLEGANILLSWNFPREVLPQEYPRLQQVTF